MPTDPETTEPETTEPIRYEDFELEIRSTADGFETRVLQSPWGRVSEPFSLPFQPDRLERLLRGLERGMVRDLSPAPGAPPEPAPDPASDPVLDPAFEASSRPRQDLPFELPVERLGGALARHLFPGRVGHFLYGCLGLVEGWRTSGRQVGLRLRICFDRQERFASLAALPWELLFLDERLRFVNQSRWTPVVRYLDAGNPSAHRMRSTPRVLLVDSAPVDLDTGKERRALRKELEGWQGTDDREPVKVDVYCHPTLEGLRRKLLESSYHVVHFMGHGGFDPVTGQGHLCFETEDRLTQQVDGQLLGVHLQGIPSLRLVVLNACWSGVFPRHQAQDPFSGVAAELTRKGIPAVVAMQFPITDDAAITFARKLYERLATFDPVDAAVTEARLAVWADGPSSIEWATPVLFLGIEDGHIFERVSDVSFEPRSRSGSAEDPLRLEVRSFGEPSPAPEMGESALLDLRPLFEESPAQASTAPASPSGRSRRGGLVPRDPRLWHQALVPRLRQLVLDHSEHVGPLELVLAAPGSLAFLAGHLLEARSALDLTVTEETPDGNLTVVSVEPGPLEAASEETLRWHEDPARLLAGGGRDVALVVQVGETETGAPSRWSGGELWRLAQGLSLTIQERWAGTRRGTLHLFVEAPAAFLVYFGQLARDLGRIQLYEKGGDRATKEIEWRPSLRFPLEGDAPSGG